MSSRGWSIVGDFANVQTLATVAATGAATHLYHVGRNSPSLTLKRCRQELEKIKARIKELSADRLEKLHKAAQEGRCSSLEKLEHELRDLLDHQCNLNHRAGQANFLESVLPARLSQLWADINEFKDAVKALQEDTWKSTTIHLREGRVQTGVLPMHASYDPQTVTHPYTSSTELITFGGHPSRLHQRHSGRHSGNLAGQYSDQHSGNSGHFSAATGQYSGQPQWQPHDARQSTHAHVRSGNDTYSTGHNSGRRPDSW